jgi:uncharacterized membrane protein YgaE (UPF0421/DUF939 family)
MRPAIKQAFITAVTAVSCLYITEWFKLPQGFWAVMSAIVVMQSDAKATISASWMRVAGTFVGALVGGLFLALWGNHVWAFGAAVGLVVLICALLKLMESYRIAAVTVAVVMLMGNSASPWTTAAYRFLEVSFGILVSLLISALFNPSYVYQRLHDAFIKRKPSSVDSSSQDV